jgi:hypothetical protein
MYQILSGPSRSVPVSTPALINESSFNVTYERDALPYVPSGAMAS